MDTDPKTIIDEFCNVCLEARYHFDFYRSLFESSERDRNLCSTIAPSFFSNLNLILIQHLILDFCKLTDSAKSGSENTPNLTTRFIVEEIIWPENIKQQLKTANEPLMQFRRLVLPARNKRVAHNDLNAQVVQKENLGGFPRGADIDFYADLQTFINIAYGYLNNGESRPIAFPMSIDTHKLVRALEKAVTFDQCRKCEPHERELAILDYEDS